MAQLKSAKDIFKVVGKNFLTPKVLSYHEAGLYAIELATGTGVHYERLFGVSVMKRDKTKPLRDAETKAMSKLLTSRQEAESYITSLGVLR